MTATARRLFCTVFAATILACGSTPSPPPTPPPTPTPTPIPSATPAPTPAPEGERITGTERFGWDQRAADGVELATFRYAIYVDGARTELTDATCATTAATGAGFACGARLPPMSPGAHSLELAAFIVVDGAPIESARSPALHVLLVAAGDAPARARDGWASRSIELMTTLDQVKLRAALVADGLDEPTDAAVTPDGRVFIAERRGRVRVVSDGRLQPEPALELSETSSAGEGGLLALAIDPRFDRTHFVYALYTTGKPSFRIARFREAGGTLADRVVLVDDIPASPARAAASLRFGPDGKLYAALDDAGHARLAGDLASFNGKILRLNSDGTTPTDQAGATPVYSYEYRSPRGFDWQPTTGTLWIADADRPGSTRLSVVVERESRPKRTTMRTAYALSPGAGAASLAFYRHSRIAAFSGNLLIASEEGRHLLRVRLDVHDRERVVASERLLQDQVGGVRVVAVGPDGAIYFCTAHAMGRIVLAE